MNRVPILTRRNIYKVSISAICYGIINSNIATTVVCDGESMLPTVTSVGELAVVDIFSQKFLQEKYQRGDVVVAQLEPGKRICKRVRGIEGDIVYRRVSSKKVEERILQKGELWLQGDNPGISRDSRIFGTFPVTQVIGKVMTSFNPNYWRVSDLPREYDFENLQLRDNNTKVLRNGAKFNVEKNMYERKFSNL